MSSPASISFEQTPRKILLIKPSALGDVVHALPIAHLLKRRFPEAKLDWLISRPLIDLVEHHPAVDGVLPFQRNRGAAWGVHRKSAKALAGRLRDGKYDLVLDLQGLLRSGWMARQTKAPVRVGFASAREGATVFYTHRVDAGDRERHAVERNLDLAEAVGCDRGPVQFDLPNFDADTSAVHALLEPLNGEPFAVLLPGTNWQSKRWPAEHFATLADLIASKLGLRVVIAGSDDAADAAKLINGLNLVGKTRLRPLVQLLRQASLVVSNDSGPMHLAAALGRPLVAPFGPTSPVRTGPFGSDRSVLRLDIVCSPCYRRNCIHQSCLWQLSPETVLRWCRVQLEACGESTSAGFGSSIGSPSNAAR